MKIRISVISVLLLFISSLAAQSPDIRGLEYYIDSDPGVGNGTAVNFSDTDTADVDFPVDISGLSLDPGVHFLFVRVYDSDGTYGIVQSRKFYILQEVVPPSTAESIVSGEYFLNADPGPGSGTPLTLVTPGDSINESFSIDLNGSGLTTGFHWLFIRTRDAGGKWSHAHGRKFYILGVPDIINSSVNVQSVEYFFDSDPGVGNGEPISFSSPNDSIDENVAIPIGDLETGFHQLAVRVQDQNGKWSIAHQRKIYVFSTSQVEISSAPIQKIEYFFDTDPGVGNATLVIDNLNANDVDEDFIIDLEGRESGTDTLYVRVIDANGIASLSAFAGFEIIGNAPPVVEAETFTIAENALNGSVVGTVSANDVDEDAFTFSFLEGNDHFAIDEITGEITVLDSTALDFETTPSFSFTVVATDAFDLEGEAVITINLTNVNERPDLENSIFYLSENSSNGTAIGTLHATDPEVDELTYSIISGNEDETFELDAGGNLTVLTSENLDFETNPSFPLTVEVTDGEFTDQATITIILEDVFENFAPVVASPISDKTLNNGFGTSTVNLTNVFTDADGHALTFSAISDDPSVVTVGVSGVTLTITEVSNGSTSITVTANDGNGGTGEDVFEVEVVAPLSAFNPGSKHLIYPNPTNKFLQLNISQSEFVEMIIYSMDGKATKRFDTYENQFDISDIKVGVYSVFIQETARSTYTKLIVLKH